MPHRLIKYLRTQFERSGTKPLLTTGITLLLIATFIGVSDNPPGIVLAYLGLSLICLSMVHHWRSARQFGTLLAVSVISFPVMVLLHNIFDSINQHIGNIPLVNQLLDGLAVLFFIAGVLVVPALTVVAVLGSIFYLIRQLMN